METLSKLKSSSAQLNMMEQIVNQLKKEKDVAMKQVKDLENSLHALVQKIRVCCFLM